MKNHEGFGTVAVKHRAAGTVRPLIPPIYNSSTFVLDSAEHGALLSEQKSTGDHSKYFYSRWGNPSSDLAADTLCELEGGQASLLLSSGMAAITTVFFGILRPGDHVLVLSSLYGGTHELCANLLPAFGIDVSFAPAGAGPDEWVKLACKCRTKLLYCESPANPLLSLVDLEAVSGLAKSLGAVSAVDSTFASPYNQLPLSFGIDCSIHSATKYLGGHSDLTAGAITVASSSLHALLKGHVRLFGPTLSAFDAFLLQRSFKSLKPRMRLHNSNAQVLAEFLAAHEAVAVVHYPGLPNHPQHSLAKRMLRNGYGGMLSFELKGGIEAGIYLIEHVKVISLAVSLGGAESLIEHPASMTHPMVPRDIRIQQGLTDGLIRLSVGLEDIEDLQADLKAPLDKLLEGVGPD